MADTIIKRLLSFSVPTLKPKKKTKNRKKHWVKVIFQNCYVVSEYYIIVKEIRFNRISRW